MLLAQSKPLKIAMHSEIYCFSASKYNFGHFLSARSGSAVINYNLWGKPKRPHQNIFPFRERKNDFKENRKSKLIPKMSLAPHSRKKVCYYYDSKKIIKQSIPTLYKRKKLGNNEAKVKRHRRKHSPRLVKKSLMSKLELGNNKKWVVPVQDKAPRVIICLAESYSDY